MHEAGLEYERPELDVSAARMIKNKRNNAYHESDIGYQRQTTDKHVRFRRPTPMGKTPLRHKACDKNMDAKQ